MIGRMKVWALPRKIIGKLFEKGRIFRPARRLFMSGKHAPLLYFRRLFKELVFVLAVFFCALLIINLILPPSPFEKLKANVLINQNDRASHRLLGQMFYSINDFKTAQKETELAFNNQNNFELQKVMDAQNQPGEIKQEIVRWQKLLEILPGYRDAYLKLSILSQKIYRDFDSKKFLEKAEEIDPNNEILKKLK